MISFILESIAVMLIVEYFLDTRLSPTLFCVLGVNARQQPKHWQRSNVEDALWFFFILMEVIIY